MSIASGWAARCPNPGNGGKFEFTKWISPAEPVKKNVKMKMVFDDQAYAYSSCMCSVDVLCDMFPDRAKELRVVQDAFLNAVRHVAKSPGETNVLFATMADMIAAVLSFPELAVFAATVCDQTMRTSSEL